MVNGMERYVTAANAFFAHFRQKLRLYGEVINEIDTTASWHGALDAGNVSPIHLP